MENKKIKFPSDILLLLLVIPIIIYASHNIDYAAEIEEKNIAKSCLEKNNLKIIDKYKEHHPGKGGGVDYMFHLENSEKDLEVSEKIFEKAITGNVITKELCETGIRTKN